MHYARKSRQNEIVEATNAARGSNYYCPTCGGRVRLHKGLVIDPYFAHLANEGSPECDQYYPGGWGATYIKATTGRREVEDSYEEAGVYLDDTENAWGIYLRLPEISVKELANESLQALKHAQLEVRTGGTSIAKLSALELCPGFGSSRVYVSPSSDQYLVELAGTWPKGINLDRWRNPIAGLHGAGTLFRFNSGEWIRLRSGSLVEWGESLCVVGKSDAALPISCAPTSVTGRINGWELWHIQLPTACVASVERWLEKLGHNVCPPEPRLQFLTVPTTLNLEARMPCFEQDVPVIARVVTSQPDEKAVVTLTFGSNRFSATSRSEDGSRESFFEILAGRPGIYSVEINGDHKSARDFDCIKPLEVEQLRRLLSDVPRLRMSIGAISFEALRDSPSTLIMRAGTSLPDVHLDLGVRSARIDLFFHSVNSRRARLEMSPGEAERLIAGELAQRKPFLLRIDAGALGSISVDITTTSDNTSKSVANDRILGWATRVSAESNILVGLQGRSCGETSELLVASMRSSVPALITQFRTAAWRIRHNRPRGNS